MDSREQQGRLCLTSSGIRKENIRKSRCHIMRLYHVPSFVLFGAQSLAPWNRALR